MPTITEKMLRDLAQDDSWDELVTLADFESWASGLGLELARWRHEREREFQPNRSTTGLRMFSLLGRARSGLV